MHYFTGEYTGSVAEKIPSINMALPGYMDMAVYNVIMHFSTEMWLHFRNVATHMPYKVCSHISAEKYKTTLKTAVSIYPGS